MLLEAIPSPAEHGEIGRDQRHTGQREEHERDAHVVVEQSSAAPNREHRYAAQHHAGDHEGVAREQLAFCDRQRAHHATARMLECRLGRNAIGGLAPGSALAQHGEDGDTDQRSEGDDHATFSASAR